MSEIDGDLAPGVAEVLARLYVLKQNKNPQKYAATLSISSMARRSAAVPQRRCGTSDVTKSLLSPGREMSCAVLTDRLR